MRKEKKGKKHTSLSLISTLLSVRAAKRYNLLAFSCSSEYDLAVSGFTESGVCPIASLFLTCHSSHLCAGPLSLLNGHSHFSPV